MEKMITTLHENKQCVTPGCNRQAVSTGIIRKRDGLKTRQRYCTFCKQKKYNLKGKEYVKYKKDYCENIGSRLGYKCTTTIMDNCQLEVDHINGNHSDNRPENLQTFCVCCHKYKTFTSKDMLNRYA